MEELVQSIYNTLTGICVGVWFCFLALLFLVLCRFMDEYYEGKKREREELKKELRKELEND